MIISPKQEKFIIESTWPINLAEGAKRGGKTFSQIVSFLAFALEKDEDYIALAQSLKTLMVNVINDPQGGLLSYAPGSVHDKLTNVLTLPNGARIHLRGGDSEKASKRYKGGTFRGALIDEVTEIPESLVKHVIVQCSRPDSRVFATTNPETPFHWAYKLFFEDEKEDTYRLHFTMDDNPTLSQAFKDRAKRVYKGPFYDRYYLGKWVLAEGAVYDSFDSSNIYDPDVQKVESVHEIIGIDYGVVGPTCFLHFALDISGRWFCTDEYWYDSAESGKQKSDYEYANDLMRFISTKSEEFIAPESKKCCIYIDPSASSLQAELRNRGLRRVYQANNDVLPGIRLVHMLYSVNKLFISNKCVNNIREKGLYRWDLNAQLRGKTEPLKQDDHAQDAERYPMYSHYVRNFAKMGELDELDYSMLGLAA